MTNCLEEDLNHILSHTQDLWQELEGQRVFITGGTGFFGCWLLESFVWAVDVLKVNATALILTRNFEAFKKKAPHLANHPALSFLIGDVRSFEFPQGKFSHIIHAATEASAQFNAKYPLEMFDTIVEGTRHTLDLARVCSAEKVLLISSGAVYGKQPPDIERISESYLGAPDTTNPLSTYGEGKRAAELLCTIYSETFSFETKIARCFAFVGPYLPLDRSFAAGNFIRDFLNGRPIVMSGNGTPLRSYLYAGDLAIWLWTILASGLNSQPYNVGSEDGRSIFDIASMIAGFSNSQLEIIRSENSDLVGAPDPYIPSTQKAKEELDLQTWICVESAFQRTIQWLYFSRNQPSGP